MKDIFINVINFYRNHGISKNEFYEITEIDRLFDKINSINSDIFSIEEFKVEEVLLLIKSLTFYIANQNEIYIKNERKLLYNLKIIYENKTDENYKLNFKKIKVVYNDKKCYQCDGTNLTEIKEDGTSFCKDCLIDIVVVEYIFVKDYKKMYDL
jgi:hypothetical protein